MFFFSSLFIHIFNQVQSNSRASFLHNLKHFDRSKNLIFLIPKRDCTMLTEFSSLKEIQNCINKNYKCLKFSQPSQILNCKLY